MQGIIIYKQLFEIMEEITFEMQIVKSMQNLISRLEIKLNYFNIFITFIIIKRSNNKSQL